MHKGQKTFEGECWVHDSTYAIQKIALHLTGASNLNFVQSLSILQESQMVNDSTWFISKDQFVADFQLTGKDALSIIGRKTTTYQNILINDSSVTEALKWNRQAEETIIAPTAREQSETFWTSSRHVELNKNEKAVYQMMDTLLKSPTFKRYTRILELIGNGCVDIGPFEIGPFYNWVSSSSVEGVRLRFDMATNTDFSKKVMFSGYAAYGSLDKRWKGRIKGKYFFQKSPRMYLLGYFSNDFDYGQEYLGEFISDNFFALAVRRKGIPVKFINLKETRLDFFKEWRPGISMLVSTRHKQYNPVKNLPDSNYFHSPIGAALTNFEISLTGRFAYLEKFIENTFTRISLSSPYPIVEVKYSKGISGIGKSSYDYHKVSASINNHLKIPPFGKMEANLFAGKTYGVLPYTFLDLAPGNEMYYYNKFAFNMMNRFEFIHDQYAGFSIDHNVGSGLFRFIPLTRKLKFRQFWTAKALWGALNEENKALNFVGDYPFRTLDGKSYIELGTGIDNIFKVVRIDCIWRMPQPSIYTSAKSQFGIFGSLKIGF